MFRRGDGDTCLKAGGIALSGCAQPVSLATGVSRGRLFGAACCRDTSMTNGGFVRDYTEFLTGTRPVVAPNNVINNALHAAPLPVESGVCSIYGNQQYMGASLQCVCQSAGNSAWSQDTRGCLAADYKQGVPEVVAHGSCYAGSTYRTGTFPAQTLYNAYMSCKTW